MEKQKPQASKTGIKPRWIFLGMVVIYTIYFLVLIPALGEESAITNGFGVAGGLFLVWGIVAVIKQKRF